MKSGTSPLPPQTINTLIKTLPLWSVADNASMLTRKFEFKNFIEAMEFVNKVASLAEDAKHHPDITISYNKVTIGTTTHDANGLTEKDFSLAAKIDNLV